MSGDPQQYPVSDDGMAGAEPERTSLLDTETSGWSAFDVWPPTADDITAAIREREQR